MSRELVRQAGMCRTDMYCHECYGNFVATLDYSLNGNHTIECPKCGHRHYRVIKDGMVTSERHDSDMDNHNVPKNRCVWKGDSQPIVTSVASAFIRDRWLKQGLT